MLQRPGRVFSATIDKYIYITANWRWDGKVRAGYSQVELVDRADVLENVLIRETLNYVGISHGIEITSVADLPGGTGLGSSSAYVVGLLTALTALAGGVISPWELAEAAYRIEHDSCGQPVGRQDHYAAAFGGVKSYVFDLDDGCSALPGPSLDFVEPWVMLGYTGRTRNASTLLRKQLVDYPSTMPILDGMVEQAKWAEKVAEVESPKQMGQLLSHAWSLKKMLGNVTSREIDQLYARAIQAGAMGGKINGAGKGGFMTLIAEPRFHDQIKSALHEIVFVPVRFSEGGAQVVYDDTGEK